MPDLTIPLRPARDNVVNRIVRQRLTNSVDTLMNLLFVASNQSVIMAAIVLGLEMAGAINDTAVVALFNIGETLAMVSWSGVLLAMLARFGVML
jgi:hypothetical protein